MYLMCFAEKYPTIKQEHKRCGKTKVFTGNKTT